MFFANRLYFNCNCLRFLFVRMIYTNDIQVPNREKIDSQYVSIYEKMKIYQKFIYRFWDNRKMIKTFLT